MDEIWRPVVGFDDYMVSDHGNVRQMISYSQDWARILYVGDTLFCIVTCNVLDEDTDKEVPCVHIEFRWDHKPHHVFKICEDTEEQRSYFETIDEETLQGIMLEHLDY